MLILLRYASVCSSGFRKHNYYRRHSSDPYTLYSVDSEEKRKEPSGEARP
jgi:hypothetical protein